MTLRLAAALALALPGAAAAQERPDPACRDAQTQMELTRCAGLDFRRADAELNRAYTALLAAEDAAGRVLLRDAQRAWIVFRDAHCKHDSEHSRGGSMYPMLVALCRADLTRERTRQLRPRDR